MKGSGFSVTVKLVLSFALALIPGLSGMSAPGAEEVGRRVVINIPSRTLWVYEGERIAHWFPVGVGRPGFMTPLGDYSVIRKVINPVWEHPYKAAGAIRIGAGPRNPLGTRWIGFKEYKGGEYGIHGTDRPSSVGKFSSHGCVRMRTPDAEKLFEMVRLGTPVAVTYETVLVRPEGDAVRLVVYPDAFGKGLPSVAQVREKVLKQYPSAELDDALIAQALSRPAQKHVVVGRLDAARVADDPPKPARQPAPDQPIRLNAAEPAWPNLQKEDRPDEKPVPIPRDVITVREPVSPPSPMRQLEESVRRDFIRPALSGMPDR